MGCDLDYIIVTNERAQEIISHGLCIRGNELPFMISRHNDKIGYSTHAYTPKQLVEKLLELTNEMLEMTESDSESDSDSEPNICDTDLEELAEAAMVFSFLLKELGECDSHSVVIQYM
jgi:hypothetical protein